MGGVLFDVCVVVDCVCDGDVDVVVVFDVVGWVVVFVCVSVVMILDLFCVIVGGGVVVVWDFLEFVIVFILWIDFLVFGILLCIIFVVFGFDVVVFGVIEIVCCVFVLVGVY